MVDEAHVPILLERLLTLLRLHHLLEELGKKSYDFSVDHLKLQLTVHAVFVGLRDPEEERGRQLSLAAEAGPLEAVLARRDRLGIFRLHVRKHGLDLEIIWNQVILRKNEQLLSLRRRRPREIQCLILKHLFLEEHAFRHI